MAVNGTISQTVWSNPVIIANETHVRTIHINEIRTAINRLDSLKGNVQNCNCPDSWTCQAATPCQTCQSCQHATPCQTCQACQTCQSCQYS